MVTDTLHFVAENFEAVATKHGAIQWVVTATPHIAHTLEIQKPGKTCFGDEYLGSARLLTLSHGWVDLCKVPNGTDPLALAISLVYSVPGVRVHNG